MRISDWSSDVCSSDLRHLADSEYIAGDAYNIADIAIWPWYGRVVTGDAYGASEFLSAYSYTHLIRWTRQIDERPAVQRGVRVNRSAERGLVKGCVRTYRTQGLHAGEKHRTSSY